jgi:hypothetical protein
MSKLEITSNLRYILYNSMSNVFYTPASTVSIMNQHNT